MSASTTDAPDFLILGAGAMGSIFGALLARAGHSVVMLVREGRARQIQADGLRLTGLEDFSVRVPAISDASQLRRAGVLIVAMKTLGTAAALARSPDLQRGCRRDQGPAAPQPGEEQGCGSRATARADTTSAGRAEGPQADQANAGFACQTARSQSAPRSIKAGACQNRRVVLSLIV